MSIDIKQFHDLILVPTLNSMSLNSKEVCQLIIGTGCQESQFNFLHQEGNGPALGFFQCESLTYKSIINNVFLYNAAMKRNFQAVLGCELIPDFSCLVWNLKLACLICRLHYLRVNEPIPIDLPGQAAYYKKFYNTDKGKATEQEYIENFNKYASHIWLS
jgi:hypothetical protein